MAAIRETGKFEESTEQALEGDIAEFKKGFDSRGNDGMVAGNEAEDDAAARAQESEQEQIVVRKR